LAVLGILASDDALFEILGVTGCDSNVMVGTINEALDDEF